jgi:predicted DNA-binding mobile mystery protein A
MSIMSVSFRDLQVQQMDALLSQYRGLSAVARPTVGWAQAIRESLGMSATAMARKLGVTHAGVRKLEASEASEAISLATLRKLAQALDCELQYVLVPRTSLAQQIQDRAHQVVQSRMTPIAHSMALENQKVDELSHKLQYDLAVKELLEGSRRALW